MGVVEILPFAVLNLRWNPFGEVPECDRGALTVPRFDVATEAARLAEPGHAIELVGERGRGKSMHLRALHDRYPDTPVTRIDPGERPPIPEARVVFVDESQQLDGRALRRLLSRRASFVLATHASHAGELRRAGLAFRSVAVGASEGPHLRAIVARRLEWARRGPGPLPAVADALLESLLSRHGDDARAIEDELYDHFQRRRRWRAVT